MRWRIICIHFCMLLICLCITPGMQAQEAQSSQQDIYIPRTVFTMSGVLDVVDAISLGVVLEAPVELEFDRFDNSYLLALTNYLDFNVIGLGRSATIFPKRMIDYIIGQLKRGRSIAEIGQRLPDEFQRLEMVSIQEQSAAITRLQESEDSAAERYDPRINIGGLFIGEINRLQMPDGAWQTPLEINQARLYFSAQINPAARVNRMNFLAEWMPVNEKFVHQIDEIVIAGTGTPDTVSIIQNPTQSEIPFQQLYFEVTNIANSGFNFRVGQFRLPFGLWSDVTSNRNFSSAKSNTLVNGFALKKIELGVIAQYLRYGLDFQVGMVQGRQTRTVNLDRVDIDNKKDLIMRFSIINPRIHIGASGYLSEFNGKRNVAVGGDIMIPSRRFTVSGEFVYQRNDDMASTFNRTFQFTTAQAISGYMQFDTAINNKLRLYGFYEGWQYYTDSKTVNDPAFKIFHGLRFVFNSHVRWTILEYGRILHNDFDSGKHHVGSQLEFTF